MENNNDHPFERYFREQMRGFRKAPSGAVWERIAARQATTKPWNRVRRLWIGAVVCAGVAAFIFFRSNKERTIDSKLIDFQLIATQYLSGVRKANNAGATASETVTPVLQTPPGDTVEAGPSGFKKTGRSGEAPSSPNLNLPPSEQLPIKKAANGAIRTYFHADAAQKEKQEKQPPKTTRTNADPKAGAPEFRLPQTEITFTTKLPQDSGPTNAANNQAGAQTKGGIEYHKTGLPDKTPGSLFQLPPRSILFPVWKAPGLRPPLEKASAPRIEPQREKRLHFGLALSGGRLAVDGAWEGAYRNIGVNLQYRIFRRIYLFGGLEWVKGQKQFASDPFGKAAWFQTERFPHLPPQPPIPPTPPFDNFHLDSDWSGIAMPLGATIYGALPWHRPKWLLRTYYKPHFALQQQNRLIYPFSPSDNLQFSDTKAEIRSGWIGAQAGVSSRILKRWQAELTLNVEYALEPVNLEQVNYQSFALRLALFRLHK